MSSQVNSGKAFEYAIANQIAVMFKVQIFPKAAFDSIQGAFMKQTEKERGGCINAANEAVKFLKKHDERFMKTMKVYLPSSSSGRHGDVRDVVVKTETGVDIGISAKNRHKAVKHPRLSASIDFGKEWLGVPCSNHYKQDIIPIFKELEILRDELWSEIANKHDRFYVPLLLAFINELKRLNQENPEKVTENLLSYLLSRHDFYKVVKENGNVSIQSFNFKGTLGWGRRINLTGEIVSAERKKGSSTTVEVIFSNGWNLSFRIHNASKKIEPSLKFDIQIVGFPPTIRQHEIKLG